uniref:Proteoglycan 4-like isoform X2 n=1 Tax=Crassostrea virginica TaxID=6565 RepID=A0A8B8CMK3_CRAVI|nr:proteoglycan 4-like isoform X2 [Crassostrea virginica]
MAANVLRIIFVQIMLCSFSVSAPLSTEKIVENLKKNNCNFPPADLYIGHGTGHSLVNCTKKYIVEKQNQTLRLDLCHIFWESLNNDTCDFDGNPDFKKETSDSEVQQYCDKTLKKVFDDAGSKLNCTTLCTWNKFAKELCTLIHFATNITLEKSSQQRTNTDKGTDTSPPPAKKVLSSTKQTQLNTTTTKPNKNTTPTKPNEDATTTKPNEDATTTKPNEDATTTKPNEDATTTKPNEDATTTKPIEDATTTKPNEDATTTKPNEDATTTKPNEDATTTKPNEDATTAKPNTIIAKLNNTNTNKPNKNTTTIKLNNTTTSKTVPSTPKPINLKTTTLNQENIESVQQEHRGPEQPENESSEQQQNNPSEQQENNGSEQQQNNPSEQQENNGSEQQQNNPSEQQENNGSEQQNQGSKQQGGRRTNIKTPVQSLNQKATSWHTS